MVKSEANEGGMPDSVKFSVFSFQLGTGRKAESPFSQSLQIHLSSMKLRFAQKAPQSAALRRMEGSAIGLSRRALSRMIDCHDRPSAQF